MTVHTAASYRPLLLAAMTRVGPHGRSLEAQSQVRREPGYRSATRIASRAATTATCGGPSWGRSQSATVADSGGLDRSTTYTGPAGAGAGRDSSSGHGGDSAWRSSTPSGPNGGSVDVDRPVTVTPATP